MREHGKSRNKDDTIEATVTTLFPNGPKGPYFVAVAKGIQGSVTCSYGPDAWRESREPKPGDVVILSDVTKVGDGLRASSGRLWRLSDHK